MFYLFFLKVDTVLRHFSDSSVSVDGPPEQCCGGSVSCRGSDPVVPLGPAHSGTDAGWSETVPSEPVSISHSESQDHNMSLNQVLSGCSYVLLISTWKSEASLFFLTQYVAGGGG